jgi:outer membrane usher protein FimD/PapC
MKANTSVRATLFALFALASFSVRAQESVALSGSPPDRSQGSVIADLTVNGMSQGSVEFAISPEGMILIPEGIVRAALDGLARKDTVVALAARDGAISSWDLERAGIHCDFNAQTLTLDLSVEPKAMTSFSLTPRSERGADGPGVRVENEPVSLITGFSLAARPRRDDDSFGSRSSVPVEFGLAPSLYLSGLVLEGSTTMVWDRSTYTRDLDTARAVLDFPSIGARLMAGTVDNRPVDFQDGASLWGVSFARESGFPGSDARVRKDTEDIEITRPAIVSVAVNGTVIRTVSLAPGTYHASDLPFSQGLNDVTVRIEEQGLPARSIRLGVPFDPAILGQGETDYAIALGYDRASSSKPFGSLWFALGIARDLEAGADFAAAYGHALGGLSLLWATTAGTVGLSGSSSVRYDGTGAATAVPAAKASWRFALPSSPFIPRLGMAAEWRGEGFSVPSPEGSADSSVEDAVLILSGQVSQRLPSDLGAVGLYVDSFLVGNRVETYSFQLGYFLTTRAFVSLSANGGFDRTSSGSIEPRASFVVAWTPPRAPAIQYRNDGAGKTDSIDASMTLGREGEIGLGAHYSNIAWAGQGDRSAGLNARYGGETVVASSAFFYEKNDDTGVTTYAGDARASTSLAIAGGRAVFGNPRGESVAILDPDAALSGTRVTLVPEDGPATESDDGRASLVRGLRLYRPFSATVELPSSDAERRPSPDSIRFVPAYRSVTIVPVTLAPSVSVRGVALDAAGNPLIGLSGDLVDASGNAIPGGGTFTDETGAFECYGIGSGRHGIRFSDGSVVRFSVPAGMTEGTMDLGRIAVEIPDGGKGGTK